MTLPDEYWSITRSSESSYRAKGSRFTGVAFPVSRPSEARYHIGQLNRDHPKATHICWAYRIGHPQPEEFCTDAGEPSGSAGLPILHAIRSADLSDCCVAVIRYYGGHKLGVSGLIRAYRQAAAAALKANVTEKLTISEELYVSIPYPDIQRLYRQCERYQGSILSQQVGNTSVFRIRIPIRTLEDFIGAFAGLKDVDITRQE